MTAFVGMMVGAMASTGSWAATEPPRTIAEPIPVTFSTSTLKERETVLERSSRSEDREEIRIVQDQRQIRRINERIKERRQERRQEARRQARQAARIAAKQDAAQEAASQENTSQEPAVTSDTSSLTGVWHDLAVCESGLNPRAYNSHGWYGLFQFSLGTWQSVGGTGDPRDASISEQLSRAQALQARDGWGPWPACASQLGLL